MPNQQGGKNYKKSKHSTGEGVVKIQEAEADQMYGRVIKILGNLNMSVYCNDNYTRICKVCGAMRKRVWVNVGDLVIISLRDLGVTPEKVKQSSTDTKEMRGDILHKFDQSLASKIKKLDGINPKLFMQLEGIDGRVLGELGKKFSEEQEDDTDGIIFDEEAPEAREEGDEEGGEKSDEVVPKAKKELKKAKESKIAKSTETEEIDIDDI